MKDNYYLVRGGVPIGGPYVGPTQAAIDDLQALGLSRACWPKNEDWVTYELDTESGSDIYLFRGRTEIDEMGKCHLTATTCRETEVVGDTVVTRVQYRDLSTANALDNVRTAVTDTFRENLATLRNKDDAATWELQRAEALAYQAMSQGTAPMLEQMAKRRGQNVGELALSILDKSSSYANDLGIVMGDWQAALAKLDTINPNHPPDNWKKILQDVHDNWRSPEYRALF